MIKYSPTFRSNNASSSGDDGKKTPKKNLYLMRARADNYHTAAESAITYSKTRYSMSRDLSVRQTSERSWA